MNAKNENDSAISRQTADNPELTGSKPASTEKHLESVKEPDLCALVAISKDGVIGKNGDLPWRLSSDLRRFKSITMGGVLIMGRKTYDSIGRPLPGRTTIVLTRDKTWREEGVLTAGGTEEAVKFAGNQQTFVVGGAEIYRQMLPLCDRVLLTRVLADIDGDTHLNLDLRDFDAKSHHRYPPTERDEYATEFIDYRRKKRS